MAPRPGTAPPREIDFSAVGKAGRRTGITLPQQQLDEHGLEEISHLFSSPKKPSPLKQYVLARSIEVEEDNATAPEPTVTAQRTPRVSVPRSASPRKSGIKGTARRSNGLDLRSTKKATQEPTPEEQENAPNSSPTRANQAARRFSPSSPAKAPLCDITARNTLTQRQQFVQHQNKEERTVIESVESSYQQPTAHTFQLQITPRHQSFDNIDFGVDDDDAQALFVADGEDDAAAEEDVESEEIDGSMEPIPLPVDDEEADQSFTLENAVSKKNLPNSRRKRKSDLEILESSPAFKRAKKNAFTRNVEKESTHKSGSSQNGALTSRPQSKSKTKAPLKEKSTNLKMSRRQEKELEHVVERIKSRPNPPKSLYILRRETPADDDVHRTRSGRVSFKPLAYWRNERCVWGQSPNSATLERGARFPLNSIKEIIRTEEVENVGPTKKKGKRGRKAASRARSKTAEPEDQSESELDDTYIDPQADEWETERGILRGSVAVWDDELQTAVEEEEEVDIAYAPAAIETTEVRSSNQSQADQPSFKYAKLLGNKFMGVGLVDLPPGGIKRPKNSRKMHMSFYVVKGRVTVTLGPSGAEGNRFSIGKGGFWQVPRGNQYSIENELDNPARIFFSQGCEVEAGMVDE